MPKRVERRKIVTNKLRFKFTCKTSGQREYDSAMILLYLLFEAKTS